MDGFVEHIYIQSIRVLWVSEILLSGLNLSPSFSVGLTIQSKNRMTQKQGHL